MLYSKIDLSLLQRQSASQEKHGSMGDSTFSSISLLGILGPGDRRLCMTLALHVHYRPFSVTSEETEPQTLRTTTLWIPEHQRTGDFMCETCVIHTNLYTLSALYSIVILFAWGTCAW